MSELRCGVCGGPMEEDGFATQVYHRSGATLTVAGIPAVRVCTRCNDAVLEWDVAQEVHDLVKAFFTWVETHTLPKPVATIVFPTKVAA
jgi:YgiT-type zinc finger domain-containing protein